ncbi:hypothetical protein L6452_34780 [Arctium lappa]|uniref:Uncharacterized protein n=1 Tax=Arctium lappa TaxID=4217 RepID=A0ACB8YJ48_ARCLA|nr:hypothetical protein L6452_34780 [Arctium lappa]
MPSSRSDYQPQLGVNTDLILIAPSEEKLLSPNNHFVDFDHLKIDPLVLSILANHPLRYALVSRVVVLKIYLQQAWKTIRYIGNAEVPQFEIQIDYYKSILDYQRLRYIPSLPEADTREGINSYDLYPTDTEVFEVIRAMGFLTLIIKSMLRCNRDIPRRSTLKYAPEHAMRFLMRQKKSFNYSMPIP